MALQGEKELSFANYSYYNYSIGISQLTKQIKIKNMLRRLNKSASKHIIRASCDKIKIRNPHK